jgi:hypothetical protein
MSTLISLLLPSILMGAGIAIDVAIATLARYHRDDLSFKNWTLPITITHITFPAIGYFLFFGLQQVFPGLNIILGSIGGVLIALLVLEVLAESTGRKPAFELSDTIAKLLPLDRIGSQHILAVLAVSWDALLSGPALAAQAATADWSTTELIGAIAIAGLVVAFIAETALAITLRLRQTRSFKVKPYAHFIVVGKYAELSVIGGFGILAVWQGWLGDGNIFLSISLSAILIGIAFLFERQKIIDEAFTVAQEALK